jgi:uncharacterized membrane protein YraQ (UPF0718 family)
MLVPTIIMGVLAVILVLLARSRGGTVLGDGMRISLKTMTGVLPLLVFAFIVAGMIQVLVPATTLSKWIGDEAGFKGIMLGTAAGAIAPGGPYVSLPLVAGLLKGGAGVGTMVAFLTAWSLIAVARIPMEVGFLGWRFTLIRLACTFFFAPVAGVIAQAIFGGASRAA